LSIAFDSVGGFPISRHFNPGNSDVPESNSLAAGAGLAAFLSLLAWPASAV
jgi:hypothetical protein